MSNLHPFLLKSYWVDFILANPLLAIPKTKLKWLVVRAYDPHTLSAMTPPWVVEDC